MEDLGILIENVIILISTFISHFLTCGFAFSVGVFQMSFVNEFNQSSQLTSLVGSLCAGVVCAIGPVASFIYRKYGYFVGFTLGGLLSVTGLVGTTYSPNILSLMICFGVISGAGFGLVFSSCIYVITLNIKRKRIIYTGISNCGVGLGTTVHPLLINFLTDTYGWRGTMLIYAALCTHVFLAAELLWMTFRMRKRRKQRETTKRLSIISLGGIVPFLQDEKDDTEGKYRNRWKIPRFYLFLTNSLFAYFGQSVALIHIPSFTSVKSDLSSALVSTLMSSFGVFSIVGRIFIGILANHPKINLNLVYKSCQFMCGAGLLLLTLWGNYFYSFIMIGIIGFTIGGSNTLQPEMTLLAVGKSQFASAYADLSLFAGAGMVMGAPCAGWLYDSLEQYEYSLYLGGATLIIAAGVMCFVKIIQKRKTLKLYDDIVKDVIFVRRSSEVVFKLDGSLGVYMTQHKKTSAQRGC